MATRNANDEIVLTENEVDFLVQNILPLYEQEMEKTIERAKETVSLTGNMRDIMIRDFRNSLNKANTLRHQLDM